MTRNIHGGVALAAMLAFASALGGCGSGDTAEDAYFDEGTAQSGLAQAGVDPSGLDQPGGPQQGYTQVAQQRDPQQAMQALQGLGQIRHQQCQSGNQLACQSLPALPQVQQQLSQASQGCQGGDRQACAAFDSLSQQIYTSYSESAAVMRQGEEGMARMNAWRAQMNANAATSMSNLQAQAARGQAAHEARQESYNAHNQAWAAGQDSQGRNHGRFIDGIYEGTTMSGGGVQSRIPYGSTGYTNGNGQVIAVPNGGTPPEGYTRMSPTYAAPE